MKVVADSSVLIALAVAGKLDLLEKLWKVVLVPREVESEVLVSGKRGSEVIADAFAKGWLVVREADVERVRALVRRPVGPGELACLAVALSEGADLFLADDPAARKAAAELGTGVVGTVGVLLMGVRHGHLPAEELDGIARTLLSGGVRLSARLVEVLRVAARGSGTETSGT
ncbi:MAG: hypothetical protein QME87_12470 [Bacillota bacterium]|nr:hypothetical protein [Bacillota bacterium]